MDLNCRSSVLSAAGAAYVVYGPVIGDLDLSVADAKLIGVVGFDRAGQSVAGAGDVNGDGYDDIIVGAPGAAAAYVIHGPVFGNVGLLTADATLLGDSSSDAGASVSAAGDVNADGYDDLLVGAPVEDTGGTSAGAAYVILGGPGL